MHPWKTWNGWFARATVLAAIFAISSALAQAQATRGNRRFLPITRFYDVPNPLPHGNPGDLIRAQPFSSYDLPIEVSATRILYHSRTATGGDIPVSGVVLTPAGKAPPGGWPVIAWAHGFTGLARQCAPSLMRNLEHGPFLSMYVKLGYAVVATDYAGLGVAAPSASIDTISHATDLLYSFVAARAALPQLGSKWIALGEAEGALAVAALAELQSTSQDRNYLGGIAISGVADLSDIYEGASANSPQKFAVLARQVKSVYPHFRPDRVLTPVGMALYERLESACSPPTAAGSTLQILKPEWKQDSFLKQFFNRNFLGQKSAYGPLLVINGEADKRTLPSMTEQTISRMCKRGDTIEFDRYPNLDGGQVVGESARDQIAWIQARFSGIKAPSNCP